MEPTTPNAISNLLVVIRNTAITFFVIGMLLVGWSERSTIGAILIGIMQRVQSAEISGVKLSFGQQAYRLNEDLKNSLLKKPARLSEIDEAMRSLSATEIERLLHRPDYGEEDLSYKDMHCEYDNAGSKVKKFLAADAALKEKGLVDIIERPAPGLIQRRDSSPDKPAAEPHRCYQMALTPLGADVKSVIITEISRVFGISSYGGGDILETPAEKHKETSAEPPLKTPMTRPEKH